MSIKELYELILERKKNPTKTSYTSSLFKRGKPKLAQKVGEEATEVVIAALAQSRQRLIDEIADLTYHTLVLMAARDVTPEDITAALEKRKR